MDPFQNLNQQIKQNADHMSKREWLAAMAMQGLLSNSNVSITHNFDVVDLAIETADLLMRKLGEAT